MPIKNRRPDIFFHLLRVVTIAAALGSGAAAAQTPEPKTVADFLLLVPERYLEGYVLRFRGEMLRGEHRGVVIDIRNGDLGAGPGDGMLPTADTTALTFMQSHGAAGNA